MELGDGTVVQGGMKLHERKAYPDENVKFIPYPVRAQVMAVYAIDSQENTYGETVVCDVFVTSKNLYFYRVPFQMQRASVDNYASLGGPIPATGNVDGSIFNNRTPNPNVSNGDSVIVQFIDGSVLQPVITGVAPHIQSGFDGVCPDPRPDSTVGDVMKMRYNGMRFLIDDDGNVTFSSAIPALDKTITPNKKFSVLLTAPGQEQQVSVVIDNTAGTPQVAVSVTDDAGDTNSVVVSADAIAATTATGKEINLGGTDQPVVLGTVLKDAMDALAGALTTFNTAMETFTTACTASVTDPVLSAAATALGPALILFGTAISDFQNQYVDTAATNFLSQKVFTTRGP